MMKLRWMMCVLFCGAAVQAGDWSQFLGPNRDAVSSETAILTSWPEQGPATLWTVKAGPGFGGAAIRDGEVFVLDRIEGEADVLRVLDLKTGEPKWQFRYEAQGRNSYKGSRSVPAVTETHVFTVGGFGDVHCIDRKTHESVWHFNLGKRYTAGKLNWGYAQSPLVYKDRLILTPTHEETPVLIAVKASTGEKVWESSAPDKGGAYSADYYNSPVIRTVHGVTGVMLLSNNQVSFVNPDDGTLIWKYNGYGVKFSIPSPTVLPDGERIFITGGYGCGSVMIRVKKDGAAYAFEEIFRLAKDGSQLHPALPYGDHLYVNINENDKIKTKAARKDGGLACIDPTNGNILWRTGRDENQPFFDRGHVLLVSDKLLILEGQLGSLHLALATPEGYKELARAQVFTPEKPRDNNIWAPMALADGLLVLRDQHEIKCLDLRVLGQ